LFGTEDAGEFESDNEGEHALYAGAGRWKGKCNKCGKQGHKGVDCRSSSTIRTGRTGGSGKRFEGKCHYCQRPGHRASDCFKKKKDHRGDQANITKDKTAGKEEEEVANVVLMTIKEEASYEKLQTCDTVTEEIAYSVYFNTKNIECLTCKGCKKYEVKGWCGNKLCSVQLNSDDGSHSSNKSLQSSLFLKEDYESEDDDFAFTVDDSMGIMHHYLCQVTITKGIKEPNIDSWVNSVEMKLNDIQVTTPKDVVSNIINLNKKLTQCGQRIFHMQTLGVMAHIGVEYVCSDQEIDDTALIICELPSDSEQDNEEYGEPGFFDNTLSH
jgi:hypothetical protein